METCKQKKKLEAHMAHIVHLKNTPFQKISLDKAMIITSHLFSTQKIKDHLFFEN